MDGELQPEVFSITAKAYPTGGLRLYGLNLGVRRHLVGRGGHGTDWPWGPQRSNAVFAAVAAVCSADGVCHTHA